MSELLGSAGNLRGRRPTTRILTGFKESNFLVGQPALNTRRGLIYADFLTRPELSHGFRSPSARNTTLSQARINQLVTGVALNERRSGKRLLPKRPTERHEHPEAPSQKRHRQKSEQQSIHPHLVGCWLSGRGRGSHGRYHTTLTLPLKLSHPPPSPTPLPSLEAR